jgi:hypothetical protein
MKLFRLARVFRVFRMLRIIKSLRTLVTALLRSLTSVANAFVLVLLICCLYSIIGCRSGPANATIPPLPPPVASHSLTPPATAASRAFPARFRFP